MEASKSLHLRIEIPKPSPSPEDPKLHARRLFFGKPAIASVVLLISLVLSLLLYALTLKGCPSKNMMECVPIIVPLIPGGLFLMWLSSLLLTLSIKLISGGYIKRRYGFLILMELLMIWTVSQGTTFQSHGAFNKAIFLLFLLLNLIGWSLAQLGFRIYLKNKKIMRIVYIFMLVSLILYVRAIYSRSSCETWDKGFKGTVMQNKEGHGCEVPIPEFCFHELTAGWFDLSHHFHEDNCALVKQTGKYGPGRLIGLPKTQYFLNHEKYLENYQKRVLSLAAETSPEQIEAGEYEVFLNQTVMEDPRLEIRVNYNQSLVKRSKRNVKKAGKQPLFRNILTIFVDSVSRQHFKRKLPKTYHFIEQRYQEQPGIEGNNQEYQLEAFQFFKYHASGTHTMPNMMRAFYGADFRQWKDYRSLLHAMKKQGYITAKASNLCSATHFDISTTDKTLEGFEIESFDHENIAFSCDTNYRLIEGDGVYSYKQGSAAMIRRCLYGKDLHQYVLEYGDKFWRTYKDEPKFMELDLLDGHEPTAEVVQFLDEPMEAFLAGLERDGLLKETAIVMYADHGHHLNFFYYLFGLKDLFYELKLPFMYVLLPKESDRVYREYLKGMENVLVSGFDIYNMYLAMAGAAGRVKYGIGFFEEEVDKDRNWKDLDLEESVNICKV